MDLVFWPRPPRVGEVELVRAEGTDFVELCERVLTKVKIDYTKGGRRKDILYFFVAESDKATARAAIEREQQGGG